MTTYIDDPVLAERLKSLLQAKNLADRDYKVSYFGDSDKSDPLNEFAIMSAATTDNGVKRGWEVKTPTKNIGGVNHAEIVETLLTDLASKISATLDGQNSD